MNALILKGISEFEECCTSLVTASISNAGFLVVKVC